MFKNTRYRRKATPFDATGPLPGVEEQFRERPSTTVQTARENILQVSLYGGAGFGIFAFLATLAPRIENRQYVLIGIFAVALTFVAFIALRRSIRYSVRVYTFLGLMTLLSVSTIFSDGLYGNGRVFMLAIPILAALLLGTRPGIIALFAVLGFLALVGALMSLGVIPAPQIAAVNTEFQYWFLAFATMILVGATTTLSLTTMLSYLQRTIETEQRLRVELDSERYALEGRIQDRTADLQRRLVQLRTAGEITNSLSAVLDPQELLQQVVDTVQQRFDLYYVGVFLLDEFAEDAYLRAGSGEAGKQMLAQRHHLRLDGTSMIAWCINHREPRIALDVGNEAVRFNNPYLPLTRSELALPLTSSEEGRLPVGALSVQSTRPQAFDEDDIIILQSIATALSTALVNANLFQQVDRNLKEISILNRRYIQESWARTAAQAVENDQPLHAADEDAVLMRTLQAALLAETGAPLERDSDDTRPVRGRPISLEIPLVVRDHRLGAIHLDAITDDPGRTELDPEELAFVEAVALEAAQSLENIRLIEETQGRARREQAINDFVGGLASSLDLDALLKSAAHRLGSLPNVREATVSLKVGEALTPSQPQDAEGGDA